METFDEVVKALNRHFDPFANPDRDVVRLRRAGQMEGESFEAFGRRIKDLASRCAGLDPVFEAKMQMLAGCESDQVREMCLRQPGITGREVLAIGQALECDHAQRETREKERQRECKPYVDRTSANRKCENAEVT